MPGEVAALDARVAAALRGSLSANTWRAYATDWRHWSTWATNHEVTIMPEQSLQLARYLVDHAEAARVGTLTRRLSAIAKAHLLAGHGDPTDDPAVREVLRGLRREHGTPRRGAPRRRCGPPTSNASSTPPTRSPTGPGRRAGHF